MFILSYISSGLEVSSVNHISMNENSKLNVFFFKKKHSQKKYLVTDQTIY